MEWLVAQGSEVCWCFVGGVVGVECEWTKVLLLRSRLCPFGSKPKLEPSESARRERWALQFGRDEVVHVIDTIKSQVPINQNVGSLLTL
jgi:hypothetical protein